MAAGRHYARQIEQAGADALELNIYSIPTDPELLAEEIETSYLTIVASVKAQVKIPIAVKLSPFFTNFARFARRSTSKAPTGSCSSTVFISRTSIWRHSRSRPTVLLSTPMAMRLPLRWIAMLARPNPRQPRGHQRHPSRHGCAQDAHGRRGRDDALFGADGARHRPPPLIEREMREWMEEHEYDSVEQLKGSMSQRNCPDPSAFERAQYMRAVGTMKAPL